MIDLNSTKLWRLYAIIASLFTFIMCFVMPPFQVNDEFQHFFRSYQVSKGVWLGSAHGNIAGGYLPESLMVLVRRVLGSLQLYVVHPVTKEPLAQTVRLMQIPLNPSKETFANFSATVLYAPIGYFPQALGILVARYFGSGPLGCLLAARLTNAVAAICVTTYAIKIVPFGRYTLFAAGLMPTVVYLDASVSQDATMIASIILFIALCMRAHQVEKWSVFNYVLAINCGLLFTVSKLAYAPLLILSLATNFLSKSSVTSHRGYIYSYSIIFVPVIFGIFWLWLSHPLMVWHDNGNYVGKQVEFIGLHPIRFAMVLINSIKKFGLLYIVSSTTMFVGWPPEIALPRWSFFLILVMLISLPFADDVPKGGINPKYRALATAIIPFGILTVLSLLYLSYEPVGWSLIEEAQGRHFIPFLPLLFFLFSTIKFDQSNSKLAPVVRSYITFVSVTNLVVFLLTIVDLYKIL